jgi:hypothetical protein
MAYYGGPRHSPTVGSKGNAVSYPPLQPQLPVQRQLQGYLAQKKTLGPKILH